MTKNIIQLKHHMDDYECMWNGIEDLYMEKSGEEIPPFFFFTLSGGGNFVYQKRKLSSPKRMAVWGDGRVKQMYSFLADSVGFTYKYTENCRFSHTIEIAKKEIDEGRPVILGPLDMFYLSYYPKIYQQQHIPMHYIMMVGYDDEKQCAYIHDCGVPGVCTLSYEILEKALNIEKSELGTKNTICRIDFRENLPSTIKLAKDNLQRKAEFQLNSPVGFLGIRGMQKLSGEIDHWKDELGHEDYLQALQWLVMFTGTVPCLPGRLMGEPDDGKILRMSAREKLCGVLEPLGEQYQIPEWSKAAKHFLNSGKVMEQMTGAVVEYLLHPKGEKPLILSNYVEQITAWEQKAFENVLEGAKR